MVAILSRPECAMGMAWWRQAASRSLNRCWSKSTKPCGVTRPTWLTLTYFPLTKIAAISQTTFSSTFSRMKMLEFRLKLHWNLFLVDPINNKSALVQVMACRDQCQSSSPTHICGTRGRWVNSSRPIDACTCVSNLTIIGSDNGLSPDRCQAIIWTNAEILFIWAIEANFNGILI